MEKILKQKTMFCSCCTWTPFLFCCFRSSRLCGDLSQHLFALEPLIFFIIICRNVSVFTQSLYWLDFKSSLFPLMNYYKCSWKISVFLILHPFIFLWYLHCSEFFRVCPKLSLIRQLEKLYFVLLMRSVISRMGSEPRQCLHWTNWPHQVLCDTVQYPFWLKWFMVFLLNHLIFDEVWPLET